MKSAPAKSSADEVGYSDPQLSFFSAIMSGNPVLETAIQCYSLAVVGGSLKLNAVTTGYSTHEGGQTGSTYTPNLDVVTGSVTWPRDPSAVATFKEQISDTLAVGWLDRHRAAARKHQHHQSQPSRLHPANGRGQKILPSARHAMS